MYIECQRGEEKMNRIIKFRVWDKDFKKMHICGEDVHDEITFTYQDNKAYYYNLQNGEGSLSEDSTYVLMQYTGLKDKNGKEIYEGDVVAINFKRACKRGKAVIKYEDKYAQFIITNTSEIIHEDEPLGDYQMENFEVIGNIYDNPELLEAGD